MGITVGFCPLHFGTHFGCEILAFVQSALGSVTQHYKIQQHCGGERVQAVDQIVMRLRMVLSIDPVDGLAKFDRHTPERIVHRR